MNTVTSTTGSLPKSEGDFSQTNFILSCLPAQGLNTAWLCFVSANIYHGFSAAWGVIGKSPVATTFNKVIRSRDWLSFSIVRNGLLRWHVVGTERDVPFEEKVGTAPFLICFGWWHTGFKVLIPVLLSRGDARSPWADGSNDIFPEDFPAFVWRPLWGISRFEDWYNISIANQISYVLF